jgi:hypothetical protein
MFIFTVYCFRVKQGDKLSSVLKLDSHQKLHVKFSVKDQSANKLITVHQAFAVLVHGETNREVIYVAEADATSKAYLFELVCTGFPSQK